MGIDAGKLNRRVRVQQRIDGKDDIGQPAASWEDVATLWANISGSTGLGTITRLQDNVPASVEKYSIRLRFREGITSGMRVVYGAQIFDVRQVRMDFADRTYTDLVCELGGAEG